MSELTEQQIRFCEEYPIDLNGKQAAIRAGYSEKTAEQQASRLLSKVKVQQYIKKLIDKRSKETGITANKVLEEMGRLAFSRIDKVIEEAKEYNETLEKDVPVLRIKSLDEIPDEAMASIGEISKNRDGSFKVKMYNKEGPLDKLAKHLGLYEADNEQKKESVLDGLPLQDKIKVVQFIQGLKDGNNQ